MENGPVTNYGNDYFILSCFQLSLRENPLVVRFVQEISLHPPSLLELAARVIRTSSISFEPHEVPKTLREYLNTAHHCVNPKCKGELINFSIYLLICHICVCALIGFCTPFFEIQIIIVLSKTQRHTHTHSHIYSLIYKCHKLHC